MRQLELNLSPRDEHHGPIQPWRYRFSDQGLIEQGRGKRYVYGLWDKLFGCWEIDLEGHVSRELIPTWKPLNTNGVWRDQLKVRFENPLNHTRTFSPKWRYEANAAFAGYFAGIPQRIRAVAAPMERHQWLSLDMIWQVPEFAHFLDDESFNGTQQYAFACMALSRAKYLSRGARRDLATSIMTTKRPDLLSRLTTAPSSRATVRLLNKLGDRPCSTDVYRILIEFVHHDRRSKLLHHLENIEPHALGLLSRFPDGFMTPNFMRILFEEPDECELLSAIEDYDAGSGFRTVVNLFPAMSQTWRDRIHTSLQTIKNAGDIPEWGDRWAQRLTEVVRFPPPPFAAIRHLIPLATPLAVRQEAQEMQNCISSMIGNILTGYIYFYTWDGPEPATVMLEQTSDDGWCFSNALGHNNRTLSSETLGYIERVVESALAV